MLLVQCYIPDIHFEELQESITVSGHLIPIKYFIDHLVICTICISSQLYENHNSLHICVPIRPFFMANGKTKNKKQQKCENFVAAKKVEKNCRWPFMGWRKEKKKSGEYTGSTPTFSATYHAARREVQVCMLITHCRVWINRVRLPVLLVVNSTRKNKISLSSFVPENLVWRDRVV